MDEEKLERRERFLKKRERSTGKSLEVQGVTHVITLVYKVKIKLLINIL